MAEASEGKRGKRGPRNSRNLLKSIIIIGVVLVVGTLVMSTVTLIQQHEVDNIYARLVNVKQEAITRTDETCLLFERSHLNDVQQLRETYIYLQQLTPDERAQSLNRFIILRLSETEKKAKLDSAPAFCDKPGVKSEHLYKRTHGREGKPPVGRPEPDPPIPQRPKTLIKP